MVKPPEEVIFNILLPSCKINYLPGNQNLLLLLVE
jgi:hypothetical protein